MLLEILIGDGWLVTRHRMPVPFLAAYRERIQDQREIGRLQSVDLLVAILDAWVDTYFAAAEDLERGVDELDDAALRTDRDSPVAAGADAAADRPRAAARERAPGGRGRDRATGLHPGALRQGSGGDPGIVGRLDRATDAFTSAREHAHRHLRRAHDPDGPAHERRDAGAHDRIGHPASGGRPRRNDGDELQGAFFDNTNMFYVVIAIMVAIAAGTLVFARSRQWL